MSEANESGESRGQLLYGLPANHFRVVVADPPWFFKTRTDVVSKRDPRSHYKGGVMAAQDIERLDVGSIAAESCHLFLWVTGPCLEQSFRVMKAWGFRYSGIAFTWVKLKKRYPTSQFRMMPADDHDFHVGLGFTTRKNVELCLLGRRGAARRNAKNVRELIIAPRREHSRKPDEAIANIERYADGPYLELFGREQRPGWTVVGDESDKFSRGGLCQETIDLPSVPSGAVL